MARMADQVNFMKNLALLGAALGMAAIPRSVQLRWLSRFEPRRSHQFCLLIGNMPLASPDPLSLFSKWAREFGDIFYYRAAWIHVYFFNHPELSEAVLVRKYQNFLKDHVVRKSRRFFG